MNHKLHVCEDDFKRDKELGVDQSLAGKSEEVSCVDKKLGKDKSVAGKSEENSCNDKKLGVDEPLAS